MSTDRLDRCTKCGRLKMRRAGSPWSPFYGWAVCEPCQARAVQRIRNAYDRVTPRVTAPDEGQGR